MEGVHHVISDTIVGQSRWETHHEIIFQEENPTEYYRLRVRYPSTENSGDGPDWDEVVTCTRMVPIEVMVTKYVPYEEST